MQTDEELQALVSMIAHEIRNPVTLINSYFQLIETQHPQVCSFAYWDTIRQEMSHLTKLLNDIGSYQSGLRLQMRTASPSLWLSDYAKALAPLLEQSCHLEFHCNVAPDLPALPFDESKLRQVLDNLVRNACEALSETIAMRKPAHLFLDAYAQNDAVCIRIRDNGCGFGSAPEGTPENSIPDKTAARLFTPFFTNKPRGCGLGLAICKRITQAHGGEITCARLPEGLTEFLIRLPVQSPR